MLCNQNAHFAFIHIPKCAGTTIHRLFGHFDDFENFFSGDREDPILGRYDGNHVPPKILREHFPEAFARIAPLEKYAIVREPFERFRSSMAQRIRQFTDYDVHSIQPRDLNFEIEKVSDQMMKSKFMPSREFVHFMRQSDFFELDNDRFVERIFPIENTTELIEELAKRLELRVDPHVRANSTKWNRSESLEGAIQIIGKFTRPLVPKYARNRMRELAYALFKSRKPSKEIFELFDTELTRQFVTEYYERDIEMWHSIQR